METLTITKGTRQVIATRNEPGDIWNARLYVNNGETATDTHNNRCKTDDGLRRWAYKVLEVYEGSLTTELAQRQRVAELVTYCQERPSLSICFQVWSERGLHKAFQGMPDLAEALMELGLVTCPLGKEQLPAAFLVSCRDVYQMYLTDLGIEVAKHFPKN